MAQDTNQNRPADVAQADSVGGMAKRLLNPAHLSDLARRSAATLKEQGAEPVVLDLRVEVNLVDDQRLVVKRHFALKVDLAAPGVFKTVEIAFFHVLRPAVFRLRVILGNRRIADKTARHVV